MLESFVLQKYTGLVKPGELLTFQYNDSQNCIRLGVKLFMHPVYHIHFQKTLGWVLLCLVFWLAPVAIFATHKQDAPLGPIEFEEEKISLTSMTGAVISGGPPSDVSDRSGNSDKGGSATGAAVPAGGAKKEQTTGKEPPKRRNPCSRVRSWGSPAQRIEAAAVAGGGKLSAARSFQRSMLAGPKATSLLNIFLQSQQQQQQQGVTCISSHWLL